MALGGREGVSALSVKYLNRLSDVLFLAARTINVAASQPETIWRPGGEPD